MRKTAFITGINGQDGTYLAEFLLAKNYKVVGFSQNPLSKHLAHHEHQIDLIKGNLGDADSVHQTIKSVLPNEIYNLASQSYPAKSWDLAMETMKTNAMGAQHLFNAVRDLQLECRIYQASSSEMFGDITESPQNEHTPFHPTNPYAAAKVYAHHLASIYRKNFNMFISCGILYNHESPRRGMHFITQKVTYAAACLKLGILNSPLLNEKGEPILHDGKLALGNLQAKRDWGFAGDYIESMWLMLQSSHPDDFVIGTGQTHSIQNLCEIAFSYVDLNWKDHVIVDTRLVRPSENTLLVADITKAKTVLGWQPITHFKDMIHNLINYHLKTLQTAISPVELIS